MASLNLTNDEIKAALGHFLGISRDPDDWDAITVADTNRIIRAGRRRFFSAANWNFLNQDLPIITEAPQSTGTIEIVAGVVTLTGSTWPTDATLWVLKPDNGGVYTINTRDSGTQLTLHDTSVNADALSTYVLYKVTYELPAGFGGWEGPITIGNDIYVRESRNFPEYLVRSVAGHRRARAGRPELFTVTSNPDSETGIPEYFFQLYPLPDAVYVLNTRYKVAPGDTLSLDDDVPTTHSVFAEAMLEAILAAAEVIAFDAPGAHTMRYTELIQEAKGIDGRMPGIRLGTPRNGRNRHNKLRTLIDAPVIIDE